MSDELLKEILTIAKAMDAQPVSPPPRAQERFEAMLLKNGPKVLTESEMRTVILKLLSKGRADGGEIADAIAGLRLRLAEKGDGLVFALLGRMEEEGIVKGEFDQPMTRKTYTIQTKGTALLEKGQAGVLGLSESLGRLWAT